MQTGQIIPNWNIEEFTQLSYKLDTHKDAELLNQYNNSGHILNSMTLYNYFEPSPMPDCIEKYVLPHFLNLSHVSVAVNLFKPGQYLPGHVDLFEKYRSIHKLGKSANIVRTIVMLEDSEYGQISQAGDHTYGIWNAGFWIQWQEQDIHAVYNFSMKNRYALQITGVSA